MVALCVLSEGLFFMAVTKPGHVPDVWAHVYRIDSILNGDIVARPVTSRSMLHNTDRGVVGGAVDRSWMQYSLDRYDGYDPAVVLPESVIGNGTSATADLPFNNTATNSPIVYAPQLVGFAIGRVLSLGPEMTYRLAESCMLAVYVLLMYCAICALPRWRIPIGLLLCVPQMVKLASFSISADSLTQAVVILFGCLLFGQIIGERSRQGATTIAVASVVLAMCKFVYMPLALLTIPIMFDRAGVGRGLHLNTDHTVPIIGGVVLSGVWIVFWLGANSWYTNCPMLVSYEQMAERKHELLTDSAAMADAVKNIAWAITHAQANMNNKKDSLVVAVCWLAIALTVIVLVVSSMLNIFIKNRSMHITGRVDGREDGCDALPLPYAWLIVVVCVGDILLIYLALWLQYDADGLIGVDGMQFRYFFPYAPLFALVALESGWRLLIYIKSGQGTIGVLAR